MDVFELNSLFQDVPNLQANREFHNSFLKCDRCGESMMITIPEPYERYAISIIVQNPTKYLLEDETLVCHVCTYDKIFRGKFIRFCGFFRTSMDGIKLEPRFASPNGRDDGSNFYIFNKKYKYYMTLIPIRGAFDFVLRSDFKQYDPYRVAYITLFDLLSIKLGI